MASPALKTFDRSFYEDLNDMRIQIGLPPINYHFDVLQDDMLIRTIFIKIRHQTYYISSKELNQIFSGFGTMDEVVVFGYRDGFHSKICFRNRESTIRAFELLNGRNVYDDCCKLELFLVKDYCPEPMKSDSGCALQTRQLIPNGETQAPPPSPIVQSGEMMRPLMDSMEESDEIPAPPIHDYGDPDDEINDFLETHEAPLPPTPLPSPMVDIPAPLLSTETPAPLPSPDVLMLVHSSTPIQETMEHSFFSQIEAKQGINRHSRIDFQFFDERIPKLSPLVSYLSNSSAHHMFDEMPDQFGCQSNWVFDPGGDFESAYGTELVGSLDISSAHDMFDKMPSRDIDALLDKKPTLCSDWKLFGSDWKLFAISFPYDRGKLWHSNSFGDAFKKMVHFDSTQIQELFCYSGEIDAEIDVFTSQFGRESFAAVLLMWLLVCGCQLKCHSTAIEKLRSNCCCVAEVFVADVRLLVICWAKFLSFMV